MDSKRRISPMHGDLRPRRMAFHIDMKQFCSTQQIHHQLNKHAKPPTPSPGMSHGTGNHTAAVHSARKMLKVLRATHPYLFLVAQCLH